MHTCLILNSAQSRYPRGDDPWVRATMSALNRLADAPVCLVTSTDPLMWDFVTFLAAEQGMTINHIVPEFDLGRAESMFQETLKTYDIPSDRATLIPLNSSRSLSRAGVWQLRDQIAVSSANTIIPVCIRPGGRLDALIRELPESSRIVNEFRIDWHAGRERVPRYDFSSCGLQPLPDGDWLIHWTRTSPGPWPDETPATFFRDMLARPALYVRSARETLVRILDTRRITASSWKIPGAVPVVSLTENTPETALTLMKWRKRFVRYTYEPYGIAIRRTALEAAGACPVNYKTRSGNPGAEPAWRYQSPGIAADWTREREWRHPGDIDLISLDRRDWFPIVPAKSDAAYLEHCCGDSAERVFVLFRG